MKMEKDIKVQSDSTGQVKLNGMGCVDILTLWKAYTQRKANVSPIEVHDDGTQSFTIFKQEFK